MSIKVDLKKTLKNLYNPPKGDFHIVDVPEMNFLMVDGKGDPNTSEDYQQAVEALYTISYGIKFSFKLQGLDHVVPPLDGLWWMENMHEYTLANKNIWEWTMMILQPEWVTEDSVVKVKQTASKKKKTASLENVRFGPFHEGLSVQTLYVGAYEHEALTIAEMHKYIKLNGYQTNGKHHEIYLSDPRKISPEKLQTILRQPIRKE
jgi:hypothetical protein